MPELSAMPEKGIWKNMLKEFPYNRLQCKKVLKVPEFLDSVKSAWTFSFSGMLFSILGTIRVTLAIVLSAGMLQIYGRNLYKLHGFYSYESTYVIQKPFQNYNFTENINIFESREFFWKVFDINDCRAEVLSLSSVCST